MTDRTCSQDDCDRPAYARGMCKPCYRRDYYLRNKERENANFRAYRAANLDREKARFAAYAEARWGDERRARVEATAARVAAATKVCTSCGTEKSKTEFHADPRRVDGLYSWCMACFRSHCRDAYDPAEGAARWARYYGTDAGKKATAERSRRWYRDNPEKAREQTRRYQARKMAATVGEVDYRQVIERDGMVCHLCTLPISDLLGLHFDHVVPLSRGGAHSMDNIKPAHAACNLRKNNKLMSELDWLP